MAQQRFAASVVPTTAVCQLASESTPAWRGSNPINICWCCSSDSPWANTFEIGDWDASYFFDLREGVSFTVDEDGRELPNIEQAEREAAEAAASISRDAIRLGAARSVTIEVQDKQSQRVITAVVTLAIDRVQPSPIWKQKDSGT